MRSLVNYCFDLRFQRPRVEQITSSVMSICYKEGLKVQSPAVQAIIRGCNQDVRQVGLILRSILTEYNNNLLYHSIFPAYFCSALALTRYKAKFLLYSKFFFNTF